MPSFTVPYVGRVLSKQVVKMDKTVAEKITIIG